MKKSLAKYFAVYQYIDLTAQSVEKLYVEALDDSQLKRVLDEIFSVDEISGLPRGDIQYWMSSEGNPQVKQHHKDNHLQSQQHTKNPLHHD